MSSTTSIKSMVGPLPLAETPAPPAMVQPSPNENGLPRLVADYYVTLGKNGVEKTREGDQKTPIGVYHIVANLPRSKLTDFYGAGANRTHERTFHFDADHPAVLVGRDNGPTPTEYLLHALAACLTAGLANIAAARGINLTEVSSTVEGDIDLLGILGLSDGVRNGYQGIKVSFRLRGDDPEKLRQVVEQSRRRSAVYDVVTNGVPVAIEVDAG